MTYISCIIASEIDILPALRNIIPSFYQNDSLTSGYMSKNECT